MFESTVSSAASAAPSSPVFSRGPSRSSARSTRQRDSTVTAYAKDVRQFVTTYGGTIPCSVEELIAYIRLLARRVAPATIARRVMAIRDAHVQGGLASPTNDPRIREALRLLASGSLPLNLMTDFKGAAIPVAKRSDRDEAKRGAEPITRALLMRMLDAMGTGLRSLDKRDRALFLLAFVGGLKRGTICALNIEDLTFTPDAMLVRIRGGANNDDQDVGRTLAIPFTRGPLCAATACQQWILHNALEGMTGCWLPRFSRSGEPVLGERLDSAYVSVLVKRRLQDAGITDVSLYSGESLRRGHALESIARERS